MSKHEIRLRKQHGTRGSDRYRDFDSIIEKHHHGLQMKRLFNAIIIILALVILTVILISFVYFRKTAAQPKPGSPHTLNETKKSN